MLFLRLKNTLNLPPLLFSVLTKLKRQRRFINANLEPELADYRQRNDGSLKADDFYKIRRYYGYAVPAMLGEAFCVLREYAMKIDEREASTSQGVITGIFDDFFDKQQLDFEEINKITNDPGSFQADSLVQEIFIKHWQNVLKKAGNKALLKETRDNILGSQQDSIEQENDSIGFDRIKKVTFDKGGYSILFYRSAFGHPLAAGEYEAVYHLGALFQLGNDIFDVYFDQQQNIKTLLTATGSIDKVISIFNELRDKVVLLSYAMEYPSKRIRSYLRHLFPVVSRCEVCLAQLKRMEDHYGRFDPAIMSRQELVCDMEKPTNFWRSVKCYLKTDFNEKKD
ncbi:MAG: hypothetical protein K9G67_05415 [Bacteroidales bacterium]|nr:hypothetical protein [Bacteroidales bacterium]MCF8344100.1 hypothetical protein [Bacteroidales bacterium]MCF8375773.1 hypothetical protein [Bacteroidales bacterium]MCF8402239.1 hypothetical protein [Bacteroidales bacterium]